MTTTKLVTAEELFEMPDDGWRYELVRGELIKMPPPGGVHGKVIGWFLRHLISYLAGHPEYEFFTGSGFKLASDPDIVRAPDISIVRIDRLPPFEQQFSYMELAPDIAIEVVSPSDRAGKVAEKVDEYLEYGVRLVWLLYPRRRSVVVHTPDRIARTLRSTKMLDGGAVLPGFAVAVADIFPMA